MEPAFSPSPVAARNPRVSVVIPAYNAASFISEALDSVLAQSYSDYEIIVVNDGSPDTAALERVLESCAGPIRYIVQENQGPGGARNSGILCARGEFIALLDSDDAWEPEFLASQVRLLERADAALDLVYADALLVGDTALAGRTFMETAPSNGPVTFESLLRLDCVVFTSCVVARRSTLIDAGLFDPQFSHSEDFDLWLRVAHGGGRIGYHRKLLAKHRAHPASLTAQPGALLRSQVKICDKLAAELPLSRSQLELLQRHRAWCCAQLALADGKRELIAGRYPEARAHIAEAVRVLHSPRLWLAILLLRVAPRVLHWAYRVTRGPYTRRTRTSP